MVPKDGKSLPLGTRQAIIERRELFQMASQRSGHKRQSGGVGFDEALDIPGIGRGECPLCCLRGAVLFFINREPAIGQRHQLVRVQLSESHEMIDAGIAPYADKAQFCST